MVTIPRYMVCKGKAKNSAEAFADFIAIDVPMADSRKRRGALMYSTSRKAREFISSVPGDRHVRCLDAEGLAAFLNDSRNRSQFDCVVIDFLNNGKPCILACFDADKAANSLLLRGVEEDEMPDVESWYVLM